MDQEVWMTLLKTVGSLALVLTIIFSMAWAFRKYIQPLQGKSSMDGVKILSMQDIGAKRKLMVVEFGGRRILVGVSENHMATLCEANSKFTPESWTGEAEKVSHA